MTISGDWIAIGYCMILLAFVVYICAKDIE